MGPYRHTQTGWILLAVLGAILAITIAVAPLPFVVPALVVALLFGWLTVTVNDEALAFRFGIGVVRRRIPLEAIRSWRVVRNPWWYGWGIRIYPGGILYNVGGLSAVELSLSDGRQLRIGTDEPDVLSATLTRRLGAPATGHAAPVGGVRTVRRVWWLVLAFNIVILGAVATAIVVQRRPPAVAVSETALTVSRGYSDTIPLPDITEVSLEPVLPRSRRTNGFAFMGTLRGSFDLESIGHARLYVERDTPPYVRVRTPHQTVYVNYDDPARTQALYEELLEAIGGS